MSARRRLVAGVALLALAFPRIAIAGPRLSHRHPVAATGARLLDSGLRRLRTPRCRQRRPDRAAGPPGDSARQGGGPRVSLDDLSQPTTIESQLRAALNPDDGRLRLTVPNGTARLGDFSIAANESMPGHLLVVQGTADVFGSCWGT